MSPTVLLAAGVVALTVRMLVSLAVVLAMIGVAYLVARRRAGGARRAAGPRRIAPLGRRRDRAAGRTPRGARGPAGLEVVGRVGLTRGSAAVAVRFGDRVILLAAGETGQATCVAEMPADEWDDHQLVREPIEIPDALGPAATAANAAGATLGSGPVDRPGLVEALRLVTARRAAPTGASHRSDQWQPLG